MTTQERGTHYEFSLFLRTRGRFVRERLLDAHGRVLHI